MEAQKNPFDAVREMMIENLEKAQKATQSYVDLIDKTMRGFPNANEEQISTFKAYIDRRVAAIMTSWRSFCEQRTSRKLSAFKSSIFNPN